MLGREGREVAGVERSEPVLEDVEMFDEAVAPVRAIAEKGADFLERRRVDLTAPGGRPPASAPPASVGRNRIRVGVVGGRSGRLGRGRGCG